MYASLSAHDPIRFPRRADARHGVLINTVTGSAAVGRIFDTRSMDRCFVQGALNRDYTLVLGVALVVGALIVAINTRVDTLRAWMDPRLRDAG